MRSIPEEKQIREQIQTQLKAIKEFKTQIREFEEIFDLK